MAMPSQPDPRPEAETVRYDIVEGVAWVFFNRPDKRNCMSPKLNRRMGEVLDELEFRDAMYHAMMGENLTGKQAAEKGMVNESLPADQLRDRVQQVADVLKKKDSHALRATKWAVRRVREMTYDNAEDYLIRAQEALNQFGGLAARKEATKQFLDEKTFKPGLGAFDKTKVTKDA